MAASRRFGLRATEQASTENLGCIQLFFTERGTVWLRSDLLSAFREYQGQQFADPCIALDDAAPELVTLVPAGDYR